MLSREATWAIYLGRAGGRCADDAARNAGHGPGARLGRVAALGAGERADHVDDRAQATALRLHCNGFI